MKLIKLIALFLLVFAAQAHAQDLIVTTKNDSIRCKILQESFDEISYHLGSELTGMITKIKTAEVKQIKRDYFLQIANKPLNSIIPSDKKNKHINSQRIFIQAGPSYVSAKTVKKDIDYLDKQEKELRTGYHYSFGYNYYTKKDIGLGARYINFRSSYSASNVAIVNDTGVVQYGKLSSDITVQFIGLSLGGKISANNKKILFNSNISVGYANYKNNAVELKASTIKSNLMAYTIDLGVDYQLHNKLWVGLSASVFASRITHLEISNSNGTFSGPLGKNNYVNISRVELGLGFRYMIP